MGYKINLTIDGEAAYEGLEVSFTEDNKLLLKRNFASIELTLDEFIGLYDLVEVLDQRLNASLVDATAVTPDVTDTDTSTDDIPF